MQTTDMETINFITLLGKNLSNPSFWVGFVLVTVFAYSRFKISEAEAEKHDPRLEPRSFTTRFRFSLSAISYIGIYEFYYGLLVGIGSLPFLLELLDKWTGLEIPGESAAEIGTPVWAALFATSVLTAAPGFKDFDAFVRKKLHNFASIPTKARGLALEIVDHLTPKFLGISESAPGEAAGEPGPKLRAAQLQWLFTAVNRLQQESFNRANSEDYRKFFDEDHRGIWVDEKEKLSLLDESLDPTNSAASLVVPERNALLTRMARFLSCALLQNESSERDLRYVIRDLLGIKDFPLLPFDFSLKQIMINLLLVLLLALIGSVVTLGIVHPEGWQSVSREVVEVILFWLPFIAITMAVPFIFAAGVQLYFMDRQQAEKSRLPFEDKLLALSFLFVATFAVGLLPTLLAMVSGGYILTEDWVMQVVPSGLTPAVVALMFYFFSSRHLFGSAMIEAILDLAMFALVAGACSWLATTVAFHAGMNVAQVMMVPALTNEVVSIVSPVTHALMVGVIGAIQCNISRSNLDSMQLIEKIGTGENTSPVREDRGADRPAVVFARSRPADAIRDNIPLAEEPLGNLAVELEKS